MHVESVTSLSIKYSLQNLFIAKILVNFSSGILFLSPSNFDSWLKSVRWFNYRLICCNLSSLVNKTSVQVRCETSRKKKIAEHFRILRSKRLRVREVLLFTKRKRRSRTAVNNIARASLADNESAGGFNDFNKFSSFFKINATAPNLLCKTSKELQKRRQFKINKRKPSVTTPATCNSFFILELTKIAKIDRLKRPSRDMTLDFLDDTQVDYEEGECRAIEC